MKNISVISIDEAFSRFMDGDEECAVIFISGRNPDVTVTETDNIVEVIEIEVDDEGFDFSIWQGDQIIRFCERHFATDNIYIVHDNLHDIAMNIADEIAFCYGIEFKFDSNINEFIRKTLRAKHTQIMHSLIHTLAPMDYCKKMLEVMFEQVRQYLRGGYSEYAPGLSKFFGKRQCTVILKNGVHLQYHLETNLENIYLPNMDDIEYVSFLGVPEIADPSSFKGGDKGYYSSGFLNYCPYGVYDYYGQDYGYNSIDGLTVGEKPIPEKYKYYKVLQREDYEFYKVGTNCRDYFDPGMNEAYLGMEKAEEYLAEKNGYVPKYCQLPRKFVYSFGSFTYPKYTDHLNQFLDMMRKNNIWNGNEFETACAYAAYFYTGSLINCGHCENMTILRCFFENYFKGYKELTKFEKLWNIAEYEPTTDNDPVNKLCLAVYALIETVRPYNGRYVPGELYDKCLDRIYELTEGRPELNDAVIMAGTFTGVYCQKFV